MRTPVGLRSRGTWNRVLAIALVPTALDASPGCNFAGASGEAYGTAQDAIAANNSNHAVRSTDLESTTRTPVEQARSAMFGGTDISVSLVTSGAMSRCATQRGRTSAEAKGSAPIVTNVTLAELREIGRRPVRTIDLGQEQRNSADGPSTRGD